MASHTVYVNPGLEQKVRGLFHRKKYQGYSDLVNDALSLLLHYEDIQKWAVDRLAGSWKGSPKADQLIAEIRRSRVSKP